MKSTPNNFPTLSICIVTLYKGNTFEWNWYIFSHVTFYFMKLNWQSNVYVTAWNLISHVSFFKISSLIWNEQIEDENAIIFPQKFNTKQLFLCFLFVYADIRLLHSNKRLLCFSFDFQMRYLHVLTENPINCF